MAEQFQCTVCEVKLSSKGLLKKHKKENHGKEHECKHCDETFKEVWMLEVHLKLPKDVEKFKCETCSKIFHLKWRLLKHQEMHKDSNTKDIIISIMQRFVLIRKLVVCSCMRHLRHVTLETNVKIECAHINIQVWRMI